MPKRYLLLRNTLVATCLLAAGIFCFATAYGQSSGKPEVNGEDRRHDMARIDIPAVPEAVKATLRDSHQFDGWEKAKFYSDAKGDKYLVDFGPGNGYELEFLFDFNGDNTTFDAPPPPRPASGGSQSSPSQSGKLNTERLTYSAALDAIYSGDFGHVRFKPDSAEAEALASGYRSAFAVRCEANLPANKVEITQRECVREAWDVNGVGLEVPASRHCIQYEAVGTGKYAEPEVNDLADHLLDAQRHVGAGEILKGLSDPQSYVYGRHQISEAASKDMTRLLAANGCASRVTKRFQANLIRFGWDRQPLGQSDSASPKTTGGVKESPVKFSFRALYFPPDFRGDNDPILKMLRTSEHPDGPMVLQCEYETAGGRQNTYFFWQTAPANIKAVLAADSSGILRYLGTRTPRKCPETPEKALELRQAAMRETGFPPH